jgi:hypothetical protein
MSILDPLILERRRRLQPKETKGGEKWVSFVALVPTSFDLAMTSTPRVIYLRGIGYGSGFHKAIRTNI